MEDSASDLGQFLVNEMGYAFAATEDLYGFTADGTSAFRGSQELGLRLTGNRSAITAASGHNTFALLDGTDLAALVSSVLASALPNSAWYCSSLAYGLLFCRLGGTSGGLVTTQGPNGIQASYLGYPIRFTSKLPDVATSLSRQPMPFFGDLSMSSMIVERGNSSLP